jgi:hypothetical protein
VNGGDLDQSNCRNGEGPRKKEAVMSRPKDERFELHAYDEREKLLLLVVFGVALVTVVGFGLLVGWAD